jgi:O-antigen ligase
MRVARAGWLVTAGACALPLASLCRPEFAIEFQSVVALLIGLAVVRPLWALGVLAAIGPLAAPLMSWLGLPPISGNEMLEVLVLAVVCGASVREAVRPGPPADASLTTWVLGAVFTASAIVVVSTNAHILAATDGGLRWVWGHITTSYFTDPHALPPLHHAIIWLAGLAVAALAAREVRRTPEWGPRLATIVVLGLAGEALSSWLRLLDISQRAPEPFATLLTHATSTRISPHYPDLNAVGSVFALATTAWLTWLLAPAVGRHWRLVAALGTGICGGALWLTQSRAAFLATTVVGMVVAFRLLRPGLRVRVGMVAAVILLAVLATLLNITGVARASAGDAARIRLSLAATGLHMAADHPVFGVGLGEFQARAPEYTAPELVPLFPVAGAGENAHNQWIQVLGETGLVGLLAFCAFWGSLLVPVTRSAWRSSATVVPVPASGLAAGLTALLISAVLGHPFLTPFVTLTTLLVAGILSGLVPGAAALGRRRRWIAAACIAAIGITLPYRITTARRAVDLDNVVVGATRFVGELEGVRFRRAEPHSVLFVRTDATIVEIPLRAETGAGCQVTVSIDGNAADEVLVSTDQWRRARFVFREPETRWNSRRVDVRASHDSCQLLIGRVVAID